MDKVLSQFSLDDGSTFLVEVDEPEGDAIERVGLDTGVLAYKASQTLEKALEEVRPAVSTVVSKLKTGLTTPADEVELKFGLKLSTEAGVVFSSVGGEVTFEVTLKWQKDSAS